MSNNNWDEEKIDKTLRNMPTIEDHRSKEDVLQRLKNDSRTSAQPQKMHKRKAKWPSVFIAVAAALLLAILGPSFLKPSEQVSMDTTEDATELSEVQNRVIPNEASEENENITFFAKATSPHYAAYPDKNSVAFRIGLATDQATIVPVTFMLPKQQVEEELAMSDPDAVALYNMYAAQVDEEALGFIDYHPYKAEILSENNRVFMKFFADHSYDLSSATLEMLNLSIQDTFYDFDEIMFLQNDGSPITFDQIGKLTEPFALTGELKHQAYYRLTQENGESLLSANFGQSYKTLEEALEAMKNTPNDIYSSVIPASIDFTVSRASDAIQVKFTKPLDLDSFPLEEAMQLIEGILLTAASFDQHVQFHEVVQDDWNGFDFTKPLNQPIGANPKQWITK